MGLGAGGEMSCIERNKEKRSEGKKKKKRKGKKENTQRRKNTSQEFVVSEISAKSTVTHDCITRPWDLQILEPMDFRASGKLHW